jgi:hypothetical protein
MPRGPKGERRPANPIENAIRIGRIATGEIDEDFGKTPGRAKGGKIGGKARAAKLSPEERKDIARKAAAARKRAT